MIKGYDLHRQSEDDRINLIGQAAMKGTVAFYTDQEKGDPGKADRYVRKLKERFPGVVEIERYALLPGVVMIKVGVQH